MPLFKYRALSADDNKEKLGLVEAMNERSAREALEDRGLRVMSLTVEGSDVSKILSVIDRVSAKDLVIFSRQFSVLVSANVTMVQSLKILVDQTKNIKLKMAVSEIADDVDSGSRLSDALGRWPQYFSNFFISVVKSGETSGKLDEVLSYLADEMEKDYDMMSKIKGAMIYPVFVLCGLATVGMIMIIYVVPKLTDILQGSNAQLPFATRLLIGLSKVMGAYWPIVLVALVVLIVAARLYVRTSVGRQILDTLKLRIPIMGPLFQKIYIIRFTRSMNTLLMGGVTIVDSLKIASEVVSNKVYQDLIDKTAKEVEDGNSLVTVFETSSIIPRMVTQMISVGEKTGRLDVILTRIAEFYARETANIVANLMTLMEPLIMIIMGVAVGFMVAAVILPMYNLANSF